MANVCTHHGDLQSDISKLTEQNRTQFKQLDEIRQDISEIKNEVKELGNGKMTRLLEKVLQQHQNERIQEKEMELEKARMNSEKWKSRSKIIAGVLSPGFIYALIKLGQFFIDIQTK